MASSEIYHEKLQQIENDCENIKLTDINNDPVFSSINSLYLDEKTADVYFLCGNREERVPAHTKFLSKASNVFNVLFHEMSDDECTTDVELPSASPEEFKSFLKLFYMDDILTRPTNLSEKYGKPIERLLYEWNYVPAHNSPKNILNALNNDCIQAILRKLTNASDFLSAAETCYAFQMNAIQAYPSDFKALCLSVEKNATNSYSGLPLSLASNFLKIFGHLIEKLDFFRCDLGGDTLDMIANYCGETLHSIFIRNDEIVDYDENANNISNLPSNFNALSRFKNVKVIFLSALSIVDIQLPPNSKSIYMRRLKSQEDFQCITKPFPKLKAISLDDMVDLNDTAFNAFISSNPQIESLFLSECHNLTLSFLNDTGNHLKNLTELIAIYKFIESVDEYNEFVLHLSQLRQLRILQLPFYCNFDQSYPANILIDLLVENIPNIETLQIDGPHLYNEQTVIGLLELKQLKNLSLLSFKYEDISGIMIVDLVRELPSLKEISFDWDTISVPEIMDILKYSKNLTNLQIDIEEIDIDLSTYKSIAALIKDHLNVKLRISKGNIDENIFKENDQRLEIIKK